MHHMRALGVQMLMVEKFMCKPNCLHGMKPTGSVRKLYQGRFDALKRLQMHQEWPRYLATSGIRDLCSLHFQYSVNVRTKQFTVQLSLEVWHRRKLSNYGIRWILSSTHTVTNVHDLIGEFQFRCIQSFNCNDQMKCCLSVGMFYDWYMASKFSYMCATKDRVANTFST